MTDIERDDTLDHLTSEELETQAFGPAPAERRSIRGLIDRPASGGVVYRVQEKKRRWPLVLAGLAAAVVAFAAVDLAMGTGGGPDVFIMADGPDEVLIEEPFDVGFDEEGMDEAFEIDAAEMEDAMEAPMDESFDVMEESFDSPLIDE